VVESWREREREVDGSRASRFAGTAYGCGMDGCFRRTFFSLNNRRTILVLVLKQLACFI